MPTIYEALGVEPPEVVKGYTQHPIEGVSFAATFADPSAKTGKQTQFYSMGGTRGIWHQGWKAADGHAGRARHVGATTPTSAGSCSTPTPIPASATIWPRSTREKLKELIALWWTRRAVPGAAAGESRRLEILTTERPQIAKPRNRYVYYPGGAEVPESVAPNIRNRSYTIGVEVRSSIPRRPRGSCSPTAPASVGTRCTSRMAS